MGQRRPRGRPVNGILILDKPSGLRSNAVLQRVKWLFKARKAGHTGSLDNLASGCLPICFGEATKLSQFLLEADKRYLAEFHLGVTTQTGDAEGAVTSTMPPPPLDATRIEQVLSQFRGDIEQVPPMYSALKRGGQRLYELAYQGKEVEREARPVTIHALTQSYYRTPHLGVDVRCSKGTYIRTLAEDVGRALGCGAHVSVLRRLEVGAFADTKMVSLDEVEQASLDSTDALDDLLWPMDLALASMPRVALGASGAFYLRQGQAVQVPHAPTQGLVRLYAHDKDFLGIGEIQEDGKVAPRRLVAQA